MSDELALARRAAAGDRAALDTMLRSQYDRVYAVCRRMTGNDADAADAAQDALIAMARGIGRFDGRSRFSTWAYRVAVNACLDELRRRKRRPEPTDDLSLARVADTGPSVESRVGDRIDVDAALRRLPPDYRAAVVLRDLCALDYAEIAEVLDIPPGTVRSRIARGRAALAADLGNPSMPADRPTERS
ncbi:MAG TPA: sigma-70 family RNA polymerase sigma factor [Acidimicrobiales bacterium]|nr:sigma-70 family RNA polymerase sigma factor [Acidimicrobiales bacterium]